MSQQSGAKVTGGIVRPSECRQRGHFHATLRRQCLGTLLVEYFSMPGHGAMGCNTMPTRQSSDHLQLVSHLMAKLTGLPAMSWCSQDAFQHLQMLVVAVSFEPMHGGAVPSAMILTILLRRT